SLPRSLTMHPGRQSCPLAGQHMSTSISRRCALSRQLFAGSLRFLLHIQQACSCSLIRQSLLLSCRKVAPLHFTYCVWLDKWLRCSSPRTFGLCLAGCRLSAILRMQLRVRDPTLPLLRLPGSQGLDGVSAASARFLQLTLCHLGACTVNVLLPVQLPP